MQIHKNDNVEVRENGHKYALTDIEAGDGHNHSPEQHEPRVSKHTREHIRHLIRRNGKVTDHGREGVVKHPAGHGHIEHHKDIAADGAEPAEPMPFRSLRFENGKRLGHIAAGRTAHGKFHDQDG